MPPSALPPPDHLLPFAPTTNILAPAAGARRKTPSELRQEQLNRVVRSRNCQDGPNSALPSSGSTTDQKKSGPRLVDTRVADIFAATKPHDRPKFPFPKQKDDSNRAVPIGCTEYTSRAFRKNSAEEPCSVATAKADMPGNDDKFVAAENLSGTFRDVTQLSSRTRPPEAGLTVDMAEALKVMAPAVGRGFSEGTRGLANGAQVLYSLSPCNSSFDKLKTPPVDLSLKSSARFLSASSLHWCHRISSTNEVDGVKLFVEDVKWIDKEDLSSQPEVLDEKAMLDKFGARFCQALHSWVHPAPQHLDLYDIAFASARGDTKNATITRIYQMWEDAFRSLYYMFCHKHCNLFYFCTQQFVVMFERANRTEGNVTGSNAYWSRSTRGLRKRLQEQGVEFSMPLCTSEADMSTLEDLHELTEFEKMNPGQTRLVDTRTAIDNNSQSLLAFEADNMHHLFDFLLNYRYMVSSANAADVPILFSPVAFSKASLYIPEVNCKHVHHSAENVSKQLPMRDKSIMHTSESTSDMLFSLELKVPLGAYITPWVIQAVCLVLQKSQKVGFEVSFVTGPLSEALNVAQERLTVAKEPAPEEIVKEPSSSRTYSPGVSKNKMRVVKHLRYSDGLYQVTMTGLS